MKKENQTEKILIGALIGTSVGIISGVTASLIYQKKKHLNPDLILENIKESFLKEGPIEGSWIEFSKTPLQKFAIKSHVYRGGITRLEEDELVQYEFIADSQTGTVLDIYRL